jgi:hypothetical protein
MPDNEQIISPAKLRGVFCCAAACALTMLSPHVHPIITVIAFCGILAAYQLSTDSMAHHGGRNNFNTENIHQALGRYFLMYAKRFVLMFFAGMLLLFMTTLSFFPASGLIAALFLISALLLFVVIRAAFKT